MHNRGLYLHIPFCDGKCAYCDFYSRKPSVWDIDKYLVALKAETEKWGGLCDRPFDTLYIGGGTPSLLGERIIGLAEAVRRNFDIAPDAEITAEMNPTSAGKEFLRAAKAAGVNRLSVGLQSVIAEELTLLGRRHTADDADETIATARDIGFDNISLDLMIGLPQSTPKNLEQSLDFVLNLSPEHVSAYILKIEDGTPLSRRTGLEMPDDDAVSEQYLFMCERLETAGYKHYEISNFAKDGYESRHNLKYWRAEEYLGIGPSAHSFFGGKRFYYPRDLNAFLNAPHTVDDGLGGDAEERIMLALRLSDGFDFKDYPEVLPFLRKLCSAELGTLSHTRFSLNNRGMAVSNTIITEILERLL